MTDNRATLWFAAAMPLLVLAGFWKTYFSVLGTARASHHFHAALCIAWVVLLIAQAWFINTGKLRLHRAGGRSSFVLVPLMLWSMLIVTQELLLTGGPEILPWKLAVFTQPVAAFVSIAILYGLAMAYRRNRPLHVRYIVATTLTIMGPALLRVYVFFVFGEEEFLAPEHAKHITLELVAIGLILNDLRLGKARAPYLLFLVLISISHVMLVVLPGVDWWRSLAETVVGWPSLAPWGAPR